MTLFISLHDSDYAEVLTDTLTTTVGGGPHSFSRKCFEFPHARMIIAGTGSADLIEGWAASLSARPTIDVETLNRRAPGMLRRLGAGLGAQLDGSLPRSSVYHFGFTSLGQMTAYAYRSESDFEADPLPSGVHIKPKPSNLPSVAPMSLQSRIALARSIRSEQNALPESSRVWIGGQIILTRLERTGTTSSAVHQFDNFRTND